MIIADGIDQLPVIESMSRPIEEQEPDQTLRNTRLGKSPGPDGILPEILVNGGRRLRAFLLVLFNICWVTEIIPLDWIDANIAILFKKGDRSHCGNYRGISLLSAVGKVLADVILQRLHLLVESMYPQSQSGYRNGRSTIDGIFTLRQLMEKTAPYNTTASSRLILNIKWDDVISNGEALRRADVEDMEVMLVRTRLRWLGHV